jgi:hypothetical protein
MRASFLHPLLVLFAVAVHSPSSAADDTLSLLPLGESVQARIMQLREPAETRKTFAKLMQALQKHKAWAESLVATTPEGKPLPYHPNWGVSESEYKAYLAATATLEQIDEVSLFAERQADGKIHLRTTPELSKVNGLVIDTARDSISTPLGVLSDVESIENARIDRALGRGAGKRWSIGTHATGEAPRIKFVIGRRLDHGDVYIFYEVRNFVGKTAEAYHELLLFPGSK